MNNNTEKPHEPIALFDMDGTLADFDKAMRHQLSLIAGPGDDYDVADLFETGTTPPWLEERKSMIKNLPGFWENLERVQLGFDVLKIAREMEFINHILTKGPSRTTSAWTEKVIWCHKWVPDCLVTIGMDKGLMYGKMLTDDWPPYVTRWLEWRPRGLVIMPAQPWNKEFSHDNVVRYDGTNLDEVRERMAIIRATAA